MPADLPQPTSTIGRTIRDGLAMAIPGWKVWALALTTGALALDGVARGGFLPALLVVPLFLVYQVGAWLIRRRRTRSWHEAQAQRVPAVISPAIPACP